jgi:hypothetical protein
MKEKIYGKYFEINKTSEELELLTEQEIYFAINTLGGFIWRMNHDMADGRIESTDGIMKDLDMAQYNIEYFVVLSSKFGTKTKVAKTVNEHVHQTKEYWTWYRWWDDYFQKELTTSEWKEYMKLLKDKKDVSCYRPSTDWEKV